MQSLGGRDLVVSDFQGLKSFEEYGFEGQNAVMAQTVAQNNPNGGIRPQTNHNMHQQNRYSGFSHFSNGVLA